MLSLNACQDDRLTFLGSTLVTMDTVCRENGYSDGVKQGGCMLRGETGELERESLVCVRGGRKDGVRRQN